jgi:phosphoribosylaminoimidazolecarboxamide formyltransferase/IMP cyclohydrolase
MPIAILAPFDKTGLAELAFRLAEMGYDIYSTSGTQRFLSEQEGLPVHSISSLTGFPEILDGRVKTLHPMVHGGILARRDKPEHMEELGRSQILPIDLVCVNLYPFRETISHDGVTMDDALENIDIGGPTMIRAAAKNHPSVMVLVDPMDYEQAIDRLRSADGGLSHNDLEYRRRLAAKAFQHVASYDTAIASYLRAGEPLFTEELTVGLGRAALLRYGENPHIQAAVYHEDTPGPPNGIPGSTQIHGMDMSYLNYFDADAAWRAASEFEEPTVVIVKHATPCGIASHEDVAVAYQRAYEGDEISPFGGIVAANRAVTWEMTEVMKGKRYDIIVAPGYNDDALERLKKRRDLRILEVPPTHPHFPKSPLEYRSILGGMLVQTPDTLRASELEIRVGTKRAPTSGELEDLRFAWTCVKYAKSNAVIVAKDRATVGIGCGQPNRLWATQHALEHAGERTKGAVLASDAFFPFAKGDAVEDACKAGVTAIIQPGGGVRDDEAVEVCDQYGVAMVFTGSRAFRH